MLRWWSRSVDRDVFMPFFIIIFFLVGQIRLRWCIPNTNYLHCIDCHVE